MKKINKKGFTLLELLAVLIIMASLTAIVVPIIANKKETARVATHSSNIDIIETQARLYEAEGKKVDTEDFFGEIDENHPLVQKRSLAKEVQNPWSDDEK